jgi:GTPase SAR1 family protein
MDNTKVDDKSKILIDPNKIDDRFNIMIVGDSGVGKTSFLKSYLNRLDNIENIKSTSRIL